MVVSAWLTAMVSFGTRTKWKSGSCPHIIHPSIYLAWCAGGQWWWVGAGSLSGHAEVTYTVNSHVGGRNLTYLTHKKHDHHLGI